MHVPTYNFTDIEASIDEIEARVVDALFHVRDTDGEAVLVSVFLPDAQGHVLVGIDPDVPHRCHLTVVESTPEDASVVERVTAYEFEQAVRYVTHIVVAFDQRRTVSNLVVTTDDDRVGDVVSSLADVGVVPHE